MLIETNFEGKDATVVINAKRIEASMADEFCEGLIAVFAKARGVAIDLSQVGFIDSVGMKALMNVLLHSRRHGGICVLYGVKEDIMGVFIITRISKLLPIVEDKPAALQRIQELAAQEDTRTAKL